MALSDQSEQSYPVVVACPECTAIYTPDVPGVNAELARENERLREALDMIATRAEMADEYSDVEAAFRRAGEFARQALRLAFDEGEQ